MGAFCASAARRRRELHPNPLAKTRPNRKDCRPRAPLPPMMAELNFSTIDVLEEDPDIFKRISDLRPDMD